MLARTLRIARLRCLLWALKVSVWVSEQLAEPELRQYDERQRRQSG